MGVFKSVSSKVSFPEMEERILLLWKELDLLHRIDKAREGAPLFTLYEGPPTANGAPGIHHVLARVFKDIIPRFKTMQGFRPIRQGGWDTHGLPVELEIEKELGITAKHQIEEYGIERFNALCKESVMRYVKNWEDLTERIAYMVDISQAYITFSNDYMETGWWIIKQLWDRDLMYQGYKVAPHCPRCVTTLSSHEVALGYKEDTPDPSIYVRFPVKGNANPLGWHSNEDTERPSFLAWTTTPWTLTANVALAVAPNEEYVLMQAPHGQAQERLVLAKARKDAVLGPEWEELTTVRGKDLMGLYYEAPYNTAEPTYLHQVVTADYVSMDDGTGIVHTAPAYGAEDLELGKAYSLPTVHTVDLQGNLAHEGLPGTGKFVKEADEDIMRDLQERGLLYRRETIRHTYPFCWRCDSPLLYYAKSTWYIRTTAKQDELISGNQKINWYPQHIKDGRFGEWLRNNVDWALSRERYWGTPLPVWQCEGCGEHECFGSVDDLKGRAPAEQRDALDSDGLDLHRPYIDRISVGCQKCEGTMRRVPDVLDAWFDSGAMPFAQAHVMSQEKLEELKRDHLLPADYICEAVDQTRGWFYTLHALATLIAGEPSFRNVICLGLLLDGKGEKMSKSKGNVVKPWDVINAHGADAVRWYMFTSAPPGNARRFSTELVSESVRRFLLTLWNVYSFFVTYANLDGFNPKESSGTEPTSELDRWVCSELEQLTSEVTRLLEEYNPTDAGRRIQEFTDLLSNWYVRRSRRRFWKSENDQDKASAYATLYTCLATLSKLMAPFTPFIAEEMYSNLVRSVYEDAPESVHLTDFPKAKESLIDRELSEGMRLAMRVSSLGRAARQKAGIRVRQPLAKILVKTRSPQEAGLLGKLASHVMEELNVKELAVLEEDGDVLEFSLHPNLQVLGPKYGPRLPEVQKALESADPAVISRAVQGGEAVKVDGFILEPDEVLVSSSDHRGYATALEAGYLAAITTELSPELVDEGLARELVHLIQTMRRSAGFDISDRIVTWYTGDEQVNRVMGAHKEYIIQETLSLELRQGDFESEAYVEEHIVDGTAVKLGLRRAH
jgi:isoleucyl-tRNA synthetase